MLGRVFGVLTLLAIVFGVGNGRINEIATAIPDGAASALEVLLTLCGMTCLWGGLMEVLSEAGVIRKISKLLRPFLRFFFPKAFESGEGAEAISANISANLLGIGNAATPLALRAMEEMQKHNPHPDVADSEQISLAVLNTASVTLIPANLLALRRAAGSQDPFAIIVPVWICSLLFAFLALLLTRLLGMLDKKKEDGRNG